MYTSTYSGMCTIKNFEVSSFDFFAAICAATAVDRRRCAAVQVANVSLATSRTLLSLSTSAWRAYAPHHRQHAIGWSNDQTLLQLFDHFAPYRRGFALMQEQRHAHPRVGLH